MGRRQCAAGRTTGTRIRPTMNSPYSCIHALKGEKRQKRRGSEYAEYTEYKIENPYSSRALGLNLYAFGI